MYTFPMVLVTNTMGEVSISMRNVTNTIRKVSSSMVKDEISTYKAKKGIQKAYSTKIPPTFLPLFTAFLFLKDIAAYLLPKDALIL